MRSFAKEAFVQSGSQRSDTLLFRPDACHDIRRMIAIGLPGGKHTCVRIVQ
jgi:hypothetical protein